MDISLLSAPRGSNATPLDGSATPAAGTDNSFSFARRLEQAVAQNDAPASQEAASPATGTPATAAENRTDTNALAALPAGNEAITAPAAPPTELAVLPAPAVPDHGYAVLPDATADGQTGQSAQALDPLDEIRRRLTLIEQAGQLPTEAAAAGATAAFVPLQSPIVTPPGGTAQTPAPRQGAPVDALGSRPERQTAASQEQPIQTTAQAPATVDLPVTTASAGSTTEQVQTAVGAASGALPELAGRGSEAHAAPLPGLHGSTGAPPAAAPASPAVATLSAPLASREWQVDLGQQLIGLHQRGERHIELHLHPTELGPLSVSLKLDELGAQAQFLSAHPQVRAAVEQAIPQLRDALASQGISLGETSVGEQRQPTRDPQGEAGSGQRQAGAAASAGERIDEPVSLSSSPLALGQVDLYA